jgi:hypothetical protein
LDLFLQGFAARDGLVEPAEINADPYGMTNKRTGNSSSKRTAAAKATTRTATAKATTKTNAGNLGLRDSQSAVSLFARDD